MTQPPEPTRVATSAPPAAMAARPEVVERWADALSAGAYAPMSRAEVRRELDARLAHLVGVLSAARFEPDRAAPVGEWLVSARFTGQTSLQDTLEVLGSALPGLAGRDGERVPAVLGAVAAGYANALRRQVFSQQEEVRASLLTALEHTQRELHDSETRFRQVFSSSAVGIAVFDARGEVVEVNPALVGMLDHEPGTTAVFDPLDLAALRADLSRMALDGAETARSERQFTARRGDPLWANVALSVVRDSDGHPRYHVAVVEDVTEQRVLREYLRHQALHDVLTGLPNRQSFLPKLEQVLSRPGSVTLCYLDVDGVAIVNDGLGYEYGDELLKVVAQRLTAVVAGERATVARIGGDEFVLLLEDSPGTPSISALAEAIDRALAEPVPLAGHEVSASAGMGFVRTSARGLDAMALLRQAHSTLRRAENGGKGQWGIYDAGQDARERARLALLAAMPGALDGGDIAIDYLPVRRGDEQVAAAARLRWRHGQAVADHGDCLRFADELGLSGRLGAWLLDETCSFAAVERLPVVVRLSVDQSRDPDLTASVGTALRTSELPPQWLWLSLDARALSEDADAVEDNLTALADMGVRRLLHSFGGGFAELSVVERHLLHGVELAPAPVEPLAHNALSKLVPLLRETGALVVADGEAVPGADLVVRR
ncbi:diguanylate cyclase (GGDEF)-like protein/PAS domain S-box-containing protein [Saccharothrix coeruleofusca]|uniref:diguanylate cyclase domain-containing protein n=1 Tax=Saccharothrix coeruleofusca TaxID=33919 RepID=UPI0027DCAC1C|nr:diguanylate cyclase [Saccharothrix coeruleofusca]MBP2338019.1 diguanylate cyclase (GGDEF)-like protein/PAS domain S-box-containing protein [Saccharothrix coeruleofusca]